MVKKVSLVRRLLEPQLWPPGLMLAVGFLMLFFALVENLGFKGLCRGDLYFVVGAFAVGDAFGSWHTAATREGEREEAAGVGKSQPRRSRPKGGR